MGPINSLTRQPIKGRKRHGGIRLGEMERDALLAHGSSFLLLDRLMNCSDKHIAYVCANPNCGSLLGPTHHGGAAAAAAGRSAASAPVPARAGNAEGFTCKVCSFGQCEPVALPYVFRYLSNELAGMNIRITLQLDNWRA